MTSNKTRLIGCSGCVGGQDSGYSANGRGGCWEGGDWTGKRDTNDGLTPVS